MPLTLSSSLADETAGGGSPGLPAGPGGSLDKAADSGTDSEGPGI